MSQSRSDKDAQTGATRGKWLLGAIAALIVLGGGYLAWTNFAPSEDNARSARSEPVERPETMAPLDRSNGVGASATEESEASPETAVAPTRRRPPAQQSASVPEETIGVAPEGETPPDSDEIVVTAPRRPIWTRRPSARTLSALYPARALQRGREGEARLNCTILEGGALECVRGEETRSEFGAAALRVAHTLRHAPTLADGRTAVGTPVNLRVMFRMEDARRR